MRFAVGTSIIAYISIRVLLSELGIAGLYGRDASIAVSFVALAVPLGTIIGSVLAVRKRVLSAKTGQWQNALNEGLPGALKILSDIDWERTFDEISLGRISYIIFGVLKAAAYAIVLFFALELVSAAVLGHFFGVRILMLGILWGVVSIAIVALVQSNDIIKRYRKGRALDFLLWDLRWFSIEFGRAAEEIFSKG